MCNVSVNKEPCDVGRGMRGGGRREGCGERKRVNEAEGGKKMNNKNEGKRWKAERTRMVQ